VTETKLQRRAIIWRRDDWWAVSLHHKGMFLGNIDWPTWPEARDFALRWTGLDR
jgi:hypothetical protein